MSLELWLAFVAASTSLLPIPGPTVLLVLSYALLQFAILTATLVGLAAINALAYALLADRLRTRVRRPATLRKLNRFGGGALIGMGLLTAQRG